MDNLANINEPKAAEAIVQPPAPVSWRVSDEELPALRQLAEASRIRLEIAGLIKPKEAVPVSEDSSFMTKAKEKAGKERSKYNERTKREYNLNKKGK